MKKVGAVSYKLALPPNLQHIHDVFHISVLKEYHSANKHVLDYEPIEVRSNLTYEEQPVEIVDRKVQALRNKEIPLVKVIWRKHAIEKATWELESEMLRKYPSLFNIECDSGDGIL